MFINCGKLTCIGQVLAKLLQNKEPYQAKTWCRESVNAYQAILIEQAQMNPMEQNNYIYMLIDSLFLKPEDENAVSSRSKTCVSIME